MDLGFRVSSAVSQSSRASPPYRPREDGLAHPADPSRTNLAAALDLLSTWRLSKTLDSSGTEAYVEKEAAATAAAKEAAKKEATEAGDSVRAAEVREVEQRAAPG